MSSVVAIASFLEILLLFYAATRDVATRTIPNEICLALALLGVAGQIASPMQIVWSLVAAGILFLLLFVAFSLRWMGGGDVKLLTALAVGLPPSGTMQLLTVTALAGGVLAALHLIMRAMPSPRLAPAGSSLARRVYAVERWRHLRHAPLPYGVAIASGGIWTILTRGI